jgi:hypothetical protein
MLYMEEKRGAAPEGKKYILRCFSMPMRVSIVGFVLKP